MPERNLELAVLTDADAHTCLAELVTGSVFVPSPALGFWVLAGRFFRGC